MPKTMKRKTIITAVFLSIILVTATIASGIQVNNTSVTETFENYDAKVYYSCENSCTTGTFDGFPNHDMHIASSGSDFTGSNQASLEVVTDTPYGDRAFKIFDQINGDYRLRYNGTKAGQESFSVDTTTNTTFTYNIKYDITTSTTNNVMAESRLIGQPTGTLIYHRIGRFGQDAPYQHQLGGSLFDITVVSNANTSENDYQNISVTIDWTNEIAYLKVNDTLIQQNEFANDATIPDNVTEYWLRTDSNSGSEQIEAWWDNVNLQTTNVESRSLNVTVDNYMKNGDSQKYKVTRTTNFIDGTSETEDISENVTVTSNNSSIISVDSQNTTLIANDTNVGLVKVTFNDSVSGIIKNETIFVGPRTLSNIADLPSDQYIAAGLGFDEEGTFKTDSGNNTGIGSEIQWLYLIIIIGAFASWKSRNEYLGLAVIDILLIAAWINSYVGLGIVLMAVFYSIFAGYQLRDTPSRSDTNVGGLP